MSQTDHIFSHISCLKSFLNILRLFKIYYVDRWLRKFRELWVGQQSCASAEVCAWCLSLLALQPPHSHSPTFVFSWLQTEKCICEGTSGKRRKAKVPPGRKPGVGCVSGEGETPQTNPCSEAQCQLSVTRRTEGQERSERGLWPCSG